MDLYNHRPIHNNLCTWFVRKTFLMKKLSRLGSSNIYGRFIPINLVKYWRSFNSLRDQFLKRKTMNMFTSSSKNSDDGLKASYNISLLIEKAGKPHTIGEELILPSVKEVIKIVLHKSPEQVIKSIPLRDNSIQRRVDKITENVQEILNKMLMTTKFSLQLNKSTLPGNESLLLACIRFIKGGSLCEKSLLARFLETGTKGESVYRAVEDYFQKKVFLLQTSSYVLQMVPRP